MKVEAIVQRAGRPWGAGAGSVLCTEQQHSFGCWKLERQQKPVLRQPLEKTNTWGQGGAWAAAQPASMGALYVPMSLLSHGRHSLWLHQLHTGANSQYRGSSGIGMATAMASDLPADSLTYLILLPPLPVVTHGCPGDMMVHPLHSTDFTSCSSALFPTQQ